MPGTNRSKPQTLQHGQERNGDHRQPHRAAAVFVREPGCGDHEGDHDEIRADHRYMLKAERDGGKNRRALVLRID